MSNLITNHKISRRTLFKVGGGLAAAAVATRMNLVQPAQLVRAAAVTNTKKGKITPADRKAAAARAAKYRAQGLIPQAALAMNPGGVPDYFGSIPNWANSPLPTVDAAGNITAGTGIRKFVDALPGLGATAANGIGQFVSVAHPDTTTYAGSDYYEIELIEYSEKLHSDLKPTTLRCYHQTNTGTGGIAPDPVQYLGPVIVAQRSRPVRIKFTNKLPIGAGGNLFIPHDASAMGAGDGPQMYVASVAVTNGGRGYRSAPIVGFVGGGTGATGAAATATVVGGVVTAVTVTNAGMNYASAPTVTFSGGSPTTAARATATVFSGGVLSNRANVHLHGGDTVWISDGTPHQWTTPAGENTPYPKGVSVVDVPDMPATGPGELTLFYSNEQSARLMFYHDHAYGITRLNVYTGAAAGYVLQDPVEQALVTAGTIPTSNIPLVIQDKTFINPDPLVMAAQDPTWAFPLDATKSNLWFPHVYMPNQNPYDLGGANACGRWDYGPWFWPPFTGLINGQVANPLVGTTPLEGPWNPGIPNPTMVPEGFMDTMLVNGTVYPYTQVGPQAYRFRILNACNDRALNLSLFAEDPTLVNNPLMGISVTNSGSGYLATPNVTISGTGTGATAIAVIDPTLGSIANITLTARGTGYTAPATVTIDAPTGVGGTPATAFGINVGAGLGKEVKMVPAVPGTGLPLAWPVDGRDGGVPDPTTVGPSWYEIGTEGGLLPAVAVIPPMPVGFDYNRRSITVLNVLNKSLFLMPAERADVIVDFSGFAGKNVILYNDAPAPVPAFDPRIDYYTACPDQTATGGAPSTLPGYGPNTRTIMQFQVAATTPAPAFNLAALQSALPAAFRASQPAPIVPQARYAAAYPAYQSATPFPADGFVRIQDNFKSFIPVGATTSVNMPLLPKCIQELFEVKYGRMNATLGVELPFTNMTTQTTIPYGYVDPVTEICAASDGATLVGSAGDGTQIWKITHNGVDTHGIHFHLFNVQVLNRVGWDGAVKPPDDNELGWKDTVRMNPLEDCIVACRPTLGKNLPWPVPNSVRLLDPTMPLGATGSQFFNVDPAGLPVTVTNEKVNFGWEYVWHCHILGHEENDMMRAMIYAIAPAAKPSNLVATTFNTPLRVTLTWTSPASTSGMTGLTIQRCSDGLFTPGATTTLITVPTGTVTYTDTTVAANTTYYYRVVASNLVGGVTPGYTSMSADSAPTNTSQVGIPAAPTALAGTQSLRNQPVVLTWMDNAPALLTPGNDVAEKGFTVQRSTNGVNGWQNQTPLVGAHAGTGITTWSDTKTLPARDYYYRVMATNFFGNSAFSNVFHIRTK